MIRKRLSLQLALAMLVVALVPLAGVAYATARLLERSITAQAASARAQLAETGAALVRDYLKDATTKLSSIARVIRPGEDPKEQTRRLNTLLDPPDLFLEVAYWTAGEKPIVKAQVQQLAYNGLQNIIPPDNRTFNKEVGQYAQTLTNASSLWAEASQGRLFVGEHLAIVSSFPALPISVPAPGGVLTADLDFRPVAQMLATLADPLPGRRVSLLDAEGRLLAGSPRPDGAVENALGTRGALDHGGWTLEVMEPEELVLRPVLEARFQATLGFALAAALAIGLAFGFAGRIVRPLRGLAGKADAFGRGDFRTRSGIDRPDEIGQLGRAFDRMAAAVEQLDTLKGEFVAHVSHELRTPLTSAKVALANVREGIAGPDAIGRVQEDLDRLIHMINELLDAARLDAGIVLAKESVDLGELVRSSVESLRPLSKVPIEIRGEGSRFDADPARLRQVVLNLVDNAMKYARSRVEIEVRGREVRVSDDGPGVPPEHRERVFERFTRIGTGPKPPGAGLGLSIARKLAALHGGTLVCEGNSFVLRLP